MRTVARLLAGLIALGLLLIGCSQSADETSAPSGSAPLTSPADVVKDASGTPKTGGTLKVGLEAESDGWNPATDRWANSAYIVGSAIFDPLVVVGEDLKAHPYLAESFTPNADFTQWDIKLRPNVLFQDGTKLDAEALDAFITAVRNSALVGAAARPVTGNRVLDDLTVRLTTDMPWATLPILLASQVGFVPSPKMLAAPDHGSRNPVGTGPFTLTQWQTGKNLTVAKNPNYWQKGQPYLDGITFTPIPDTSARVSGLGSDDIDLLISSLSGGPIATLRQEAQEGKIQLVHSKGDQDTNMVLFNTESPPLNDLRVRQALAYAIDRDTLLAVSGTPEELQADSLYAKDSKWYVDTNYYPYDVAKAKALVEEYKKDKGSVPSFVFGSTNDPEVQKAATAILQMWQQVGIDVKSDTIEQTTFITNAVTGNFQTQIWRQFGGPDPDVNYVWWISDNASTPGFTLNMARNKDPQLDAALRKGRATLDETVRKEAYGTVQQRLKEDVPYIWVSHVTWTLAANNKVRNIEHLTLPDGSKSVGLLNGAFPVGQIWIDG